MALNLNTRYPNTNPADADFPQGSIKNDTVPGDKTGTPVEKDWLNDYVGFTAALLAESGVSPSGNVDTALSSDRLNAIKAMMNDKVKHVNNIAALQGIDLTDIEAVFVGMYHDITDTSGGGLLVKATGRHNGGTFIDPSRAFPTDWDDQAQLNAWFADSGVDAIGLKRFYSSYVSIKWFGAKGDGASNDRLILLKAMNITSINGDTLFISDGTYACNDWMPLPSNLKMRFSENASWKLTADTGPVGGFVIGGYDIALNATPFDNVEIHGIALDCSSIGGENGFNAVRASNVRVFNPKIYNCLHTAARLGGRAFQFEGGIVDGVHIYNPYVQNCSVGINSQGNPNGSEIVRNINYYNVVMRNVDIPFNVDSQFPNPSSNTLLTMSTFVHGAQLFNCGLIKFGTAGQQVGGGIVCGDRGAGLSIDGLRIVNDESYGTIGSLVRGVMFNVHIKNVEIQCVGCVSLFDFNTVDFGDPSQDTFASTVFVDNVDFTGNLDYVVKGGGSNDRIGESKMSGVMIDSSISTLAGIADANAGTGESGDNAYLELILKDNNFNNSFLRSLSSIYNESNAPDSVCKTGYDEGVWLPVDGSGAGLTLTVSGLSKWVRTGRNITAYCHVTYPANTNVLPASIGGLPFTAANFSSMAGVGNIAYCNEATLSRAYVAGGGNTVVLSNNAGGLVSNTEMASDTLYLAVTYIV
jgi:hypothetical protein